MKPDRNLLILGILVLFFGAMGILMLFLIRDEHQLREARGLVYALMGLVGIFMFLFGYIPLSIYKDGEE